MEFDVVIVGAGPAGLATACRLAQLNQQSGKELSIVVLEKAAEVGAHILSGAVLEPTALDELFPDWRNEDSPIKTAVNRDEVTFLTSDTGAMNMPHWMVPAPMHNDGNYIVSLGNVCRWLGEKAESLGVDVFPGFAAAEVLYREDGSVRGVLTGDMGVDANGEPKGDYTPGMELLGRQVIFAEGCRGHLGKQLIQQFELNKDRDPQHYGIGIKELWEVPAEQHQPGLVLHGAGWPLSENDATGGFFLYHLEDQQVVVGLITDLNYSNPWLSPFDEMQRLKCHPKISAHLEGGKRVGYGARAVVKGGLNSLPRMTLPGALLIGCDAGTLNFAKIKGSHTAMKSGMIAAEVVHQALTDEGYEEGAELTQYDAAFKNSWLYDELYRCRNFGPAIHKFGTWLGGAFNFLEQNLLKGRLKLTLHDTSEDHAQMLRANEVARIDYPKPDGKLTFDKSSSVFLANNYHEEDQPCHLRLKDDTVPLAINLPRWAEPAQRYCPAGVYEVVDQADGSKRFAINAQNCVHCKTCDIKDPSQNINWVTPEGGSGPAYGNM